MPETPVIQHAPAPLPDRTAELDSSTEPLREPVPFAPVIAALAGVVTLGVAAFAGLLALAGVL